MCAYALQGIHSTPVRCGPGLPCSVRVARHVGRDLRRTLSQWVERLGLEMCTSIARKRRVKFGAAATRGILPEKALSLCLYVRVGLPEPGRLVLPQRGLPT